MPPSARALLAFLLVTLSSGTVLAGTITGTIRSAETGQPLAGKVVQAYDTAGFLQATTNSDATGLYILSNVPNGNYRLLAFDPDGVYATMFDGNAESFETTRVTVVNGTLPITRDFSLITGGSIAGVVRLANGSPVATATVEAYNLSGTRRGFTTTGQDGSFSLVLPPGEYKLVAFDANPNHAFSFFRDARTFTDATRVSVVKSQTSAISFALALAARVGGTIVEGATGLPLNAITVYAYTPSGALIATTTTGSNGAFTFSLPPGDYRIVAADLGRGFAPGFYGATRAFETSTIVTLPAGGVQSNVQIALTRGGTISGAVRDAAGNAVRDVTVAAYNLDGTLHTTATSQIDGTYSLLVAPGAYKLVTFDPDFGYATRFFGGARDFASASAVGVAAGQNLHGFDFSLVASGVVTGLVREGSQPRAGITVAAYDPAGLLVASAVTDAEGRYVLALAPGEYRIVAFDQELRYAASYDRGANSFDETAPRNVTAGTTITADIALRRGVVISGEVLDSSGAPVSGVNIFALDAAGNRVAGATSVDGTFRLAAPSGTYTYRAVDPAGRYATVEQAGTRFVLQATPKRRGVRH
jgi:large repetitive protein